VRQVGRPEGRYRAAGVAFPEEDPGALVSAGLLDHEEDGYRFRHPLFQESAYEEIPAERKRVLHEEIAAAIAKTDGYGAERVAAHLERVGRPEAALSVLETAAMDANQAGIYPPGRCLPRCSRCTVTQ
jgi:hypothetical protein